MSKRIERVASLIRTILAEAIQTRLQDPRIPPITSITRVEVAADFTVARVHVSVLAPEPRRELCLRALRGSAGHLRWLLGRELRLRKVPELDFRLDESLRRGFETVQLIERLVPPVPEEPAEAGLAAPCRPETDGPQEADDPGGAGTQEDV